MAWITPAESDVLTVLSEAELATYRAAALASGQSDPLAPTLAQVVDMVRGYVGAYRPNTLGVPGTIPQKLLAPALDLVAVRLLERVASGEFNIEEPVEATDEITSAPSPTIEAHHRRFSWREEEGV